MTIAIGYYTICDISDGEKGEKGDTGIGVSSIKQQYYLSSSDKQLTDGEWVDTIPEWSADHYMWTRQATTYSNGEVKYTSIILNTALTKSLRDADMAVAASLRNNEVFFADTEPEGVYKENDVWFDTANDNQMHYYDGEKWTIMKYGADALAEKCIEAQHIHGRVITGDMIIAQTLTGAHMVTRSLGASSIMSNTITANEIKSGTLTANEIKSGSLTSDVINVTDLVSNGLIDANKLTAKNIDVDDLSALNATIAGWQIQDNYIQKFTTVDAKTYRSVIECPSTSPTNYFLWTRVGHYEGKNYITDYTPWVVRHDGYMRFSSSDGYDTVHLSSGKLSIQSKVSGILEDDGKETTNTITFEDGSMKISGSGAFVKFNFSIGENGLCITDKNGDKVFEIPMEAFMSNNPISCYHPIYCPSGFFFNQNTTDTLAEKYGMYKSSSNTTVVGKYSSLDAYGATGFNYDLGYKVTFNGTCFRPDSADMTIQLGYSSNRFKTAYFSDTIYLAGGYEKSSDRKVKTDIHSIDEQWAKQFIMNLDPSFFKYKKDDIHSGARTHMGMIAQDVHALGNEMNTDLAVYSAYVTPEITEDSMDDDYEWTYYDDTMDVEDEKLEWSLKYDEFVAPLIKVVQTQQKTIDDLTARLEALESKISNIENNINNTK